MRRQKARETAFLLLYRMDMGRLTLEEASEFVEKRPDPDIWDYALNLAKGALENLSEIDRLISHHSHGWELDRMVSTDRNILRLAVFELLYGKEIPPAVITDQALKLANKFGTPTSAKFINGILGAILREKSGESIPGES